MTSQRIYEIFKLAGKLIALSDLGDDYSASLKAAITATEQQIATASGSPDRYSNLIGITLPLATSMRNVTSAVDRLPLVARSAFENLLRVIAPELNEDPSAPAATIATALKAAMVSTGDSVQASGNFDDYLIYYGGVPVDADPTIPDGLITITVIE